MNSFPKEYTPKWGSLMIMVRPVGQDFSEIEIQATGKLGNISMVRDAESLSILASWLEGNQWLIGNTLNLCVGPITEPSDHEWLRKTLSEIATELRTMELEQAPTKILQYPPSAKTA